MCANVLVEGVDMMPIPEVVVLACAQAVPEPLALQQALQQVGLHSRIIPEPCSSKVEAFHLLRILAQGVSLVWVVGCPEQYCQLAEGSTRMGFRVAHAQSYLVELGLEPERLGYSRIAAGNDEAQAAVVAAIGQRLRQLPPNPARPRPRA